MASKPNIGIIGNGNVGSNLEKGLSKAGYNVRTSGHDAKEVEQVAKDSDIIIVAVPSDQLPDVVKEMNGQHKGKIIVDVTNPLASDGSFGGSLKQSNAEKLQTLARDAKIVKAFNTVFAANMATGHANGHRLSAFVAGDDEESRHQVEALATDLGFDAVDAGELENARYLETLAYLNIALGYKQNMGTDIGFRLVHGNGARN